MNDHGVFWCLGMYASGSTWLYNVVRQIATSHGSLTPVHLHFASSHAGLAGLSQPDVAHIVKTHQIDDEPGVDALCARATAIFVTVRDPRDVVASLMTYHAMAFDQAADLASQSMSLCARFAEDARARLFRYEDGFVDNLATLDVIARALGSDLATADRDRIFAATRRPAIETLIASQANLPTTLVSVTSDDRLDPVTQWHSHHVGRTGQVGRWRAVLTSAQADTLVRRTRDGMATFSYATSA